MVGTERESSAERVEIDIVMCHYVPGLVAPDPALPISSESYLKRH